ncbi:pirin domain-containing protein [Fomitopsis serialis]|uniref:pirin domain-containing protein n=1 Tax=Fomitopsis serialis TaxID=139415 RepID=UPI00200888EA|nr:pirin domain-containing protein [Neoantrodia serialis]KAH9933450.1 pirin domain-containing protein [Neoantrodia serialis]
MKIVPRRSHERGNADHGWLKTFHTFSFAMYSDPQHDHFGCLRVLNEDRVEPQTGFGTHPHREFEIFSYIVSGQLEHQDSMGNREILKRGNLQMTSAGTGIRHSEKCYGPEQVHFLQIWSMPSTRGLTPTYYTRHFSDDEKHDKWALVVAPADAADVSEARDASGPAPVHAPLSLYATLLSPSKSLPHTFPTAGSGLARKAYIHVVQTSGYNPKQASGTHVKVSGDESVLELREGDGAYIMGEPGKEMVVENVGGSVAEILLFDVE